MAKDTKQAQAVAVEIEQKRRVGLSTPLTDIFLALVVLAGVSNLVGSLLGLH